MKATHKLLCRESPHAILPRERALRHGVQGLSDLDLVQAILGSGTKQQPVRPLSAQVLALVESKGPELSLDDLMAIKGMGSAKATLLCGALELARRLLYPQRRRIRLPTDVLPVISHYADRDQEYFLCVSLNGANEVISSKIVTIGLVNRTLVHPREVYAQALAERATAIIVAHNHPSGNLEPSQDDREITTRLSRAGDILGIKLLDHLIISPNGYGSMLEMGLL